LIAKPGNTLETAGALGDSMKGITQFAIAKWGGISAITADIGCSSSP
jgi:hypothetical protein